MKASLSREWLLTSLALLALVLWLSPAQQLPRANLWLKDMVLRLQPAPPAPEVVLIAVDEPSLASIGRWPWRRALHAHLIHYVSSGQPHAIGLDFLLTEPDLDYPEDDALLARSMAHSGRVVLPVVSGGSAASTQLPLPLFAQAAARLGHAHLPLDADGGVRSFYTREGLGHHQWLHLAPAMLCLSQPQNADCAHTAHRSVPASPDLWQREGLTHIAFARGHTPFTTYAYIDVLRQQVPADAFRNKHVLIGTTAQGLGATPRPPGSTTPSALHNVEVIAHVLSGTLQQQHLHDANPWANRLFNLLPVALGLAALSVLGPSTALLTCLGLAVLTVVAQATAAATLQTLFSPAAALLALLLIYPLWSWRRLNAAAQFLNQEMQKLRTQILNPQSPPPPKLGDFLQNRLQAVEQASEQLHQLHHFVTQTLLQLPSPTMVCNHQGQIVLANSATHRYAQSLGRQLHRLHPMAQLLEGCLERSSLQPLWDPAAPPPQDQSIQREGVDPQQHSLLLLSKPFEVAGETGWLVSLVDISELHSALAQRDQALHFISHDIRAPLSAILTLIEIAHTYRTPQPELLERIQRAAHNGLSLADGFVQLTRAQHSPVQRVPVELSDVMEQALDDVWAAAHARHIHMAWSPPAHEAWVLGDASMLRRACVNLLSNAIKYGPAHGTVHCSLHRCEADWCLSIRDEGPGISPLEQQRLFTPFNRQAQHADSAIPGVGLGLAYVRAAALQHGGSVTVDSQIGQGSCFTLRLPRALTPPP